jgi:hypothetical protein
MAVFDVGHEGGEVSKPIFDGVAFRIREIARSRTGRLNHGGFCSLPLSAHLIGPDPDGIGEAAVILKDLDPYACGKIRERAAGFA